MALVEIEKVAGWPLTARAAKSEPPDAIRVHGKFFFVGEQKYFIKGVTYGPFPKGSHGQQFPEYATAEADFAAMVEAGINTVRVFTVPRSGCSMQPNKRV